MIHSILATQNARSASTSEERRNLETIVQGTRDFNHRQPSHIALGFAQGYEWISPFFDYRPLRGIQAAEAGLVQILEMFPDTHYKIERNFAQGSLTETLFTVTGTRIQGFLGLPPKNVPYRFFTSVINEFDEQGRRWRTWETWDRLLLLQQLGVQIQSDGQPIASPAAGGQFPDEGPTIEQIIPEYQPGGGPWQAIEKRNYESVARGIVAFNAKQAAKSVADLSPDSVWRSNAFPKPIIGKENAARYIAYGFEIFPDTTFNLIHMFAWRNFVQVIFLATGSKSRGFLGLPPRNRPFQYFRSVLSRYDRRGQRVEVWDTWDEAAVLRDQGFMPWTFSSEGNSAPNSTRLQLEDSSAFGTTARLVAASVNQTDDGPKSCERNPLRPDPGQLEDPVGDPGSPTRSPKLSKQLIGRLTAETSPQIDRAIETTVSRIPVLNFLGVVEKVDHTDSGSVTQHISLRQTSFRNSIETTIGPPLGSATLKYQAPRPVDGASSTKISISGSIRFDSRSRESLQFEGSGDMPGDMPSDLPFGQGNPGGQHHQRLFSTVLRSSREDSGFLTLAGCWPAAPGSTTQFCLHLPGIETRRSARSRRQRSQIARSDQDLVLVLYSHLDASLPHAFGFGQSGEFLGGSASETIQLADFETSLKGRHVISKRFLGGPVGVYAFELDFPHSLGLGGATAAFTAAKIKLQLSNIHGQDLGYLSASGSSGKACRIPVNGVPVPVFSIAASGPLRTGGGAFAGVEGTWTLNALHTAVPGYTSSIHTLQLRDPDGTLAAELRHAWS